MARKSKYQTVNTASPAACIQWRAGLYIRLSREDGDKPESESVSSQRALLEGFAAAQPDLTVHEFYIDDGWSGTDFNRPAFARMLADATERKINCVVVKDLSRFGRNYVEAGKYLETVFPLLRVRFISVNDRIDSVEDPASLNSVIVPFKNIINDEYCRDISQKVRSALDVRRKQGKFIGSFAAYGYCKDKADHNKLVVDGEAAQTVREIFRRFTEGNSILGIARGLNAAGVPNPSAYRAQKGLCRNTKGGLWTDSTVRRILTNEVYLGNLVQKKIEIVSYKVHAAKPVAADKRIVVKNTHEAIISEEEFLKVRSLLARDTRSSPVSGKLSALAGFLKCADCGRAMQKRTVKQPYKTYDYYCCSTYKKLHSKACTKHAVRAEAVEEAVLAALNGYIRRAVDFERLFRELDAAERQSGTSRRLSAELARSEREEQRANGLLLDLYPDYKGGIISREQYFALKERYEKAALRAREEAARLRAEIEALRRGGAENEFVATFKKYRGFQTLTRDILCELVENIYIHEGGEIELRLKCRRAYLSAEEYFAERQRDNTVDLPLISGHSNGHAERT